jgi:hypothetical protein
MNRHPILTALTVLALAISEGRSQDRAAVPAPAKEHFSEEALALQGVWMLSAPGETSVVMARLIVHGSYLLLIYQFEGKEAREVEIQGFRADDRIRNREGDPVLDYVFSEDHIVHLEIRDQSRYAQSDYMEISLKRTGRFPDLGLDKAKN